MQEFEGKRMLGIHKAKCSAPIVLRIRVPRFFRSGLMMVTLQLKGVSGK